ncbi:MAG TPA: zinc ribbon domain-containing protein [Planctomycetota bacterium]|jgi:hypothetical protein|nr:zinc ribbon domain-containing protein [Planctomycetota bacterium]
MTRKISEGRKIAFYAGSGLMALGAISFGSVFVTGIANFGDHSMSIHGGTEGVRAVAGMALLIVGMGLRGIGAAGLAGAGVILDPERAKEELEPYSRMAGGMAKDLLDEADVNLGGKSERVVMIRCLACDKLNEEDSKFCQECGEEI